MIYDVSEGMWSDASLSPFFPLSLITQFACSSRMGTGMERSEKDMRVAGDGCAAPVVAQNAFQCRFASIASLSVKLSKWIMSPSSTAELSSHESWVLSFCGFQFTVSSGDAANDKNLTKMLQNAKEKKPKKINNNINLKANKRLRRSSSSSRRREEYKSEIWHIKLGTQTSHVINLFVMSSPKKRENIALYKIISPIS